MGHGIHAVEIVFLLLLLFVAAFGLLAGKLKTPYPIVMVIGGLLLSFVPGIPRIMLNPDVVFFIILPPLLYSAAWLTSWRSFSRNLVSIFLLAVGLVMFTVVGVALFAPMLLRDFDWRMGFVLGAAVATTDAIAATAIARRVGLPKNVVDILEGESLVNDASGLLALEFGIAMLLRNETPTISSGIARLGYLTVAGLGVGLLMGVVVHWIEDRIEDGPIEISISILIPYATYLAAESIHASGVLAVVAAGLYLSRESSHFFSANVRLQAWAVWDSLSFVLNGLAFVLIGLQLPYVLQGIKNYSRGTLVLYGALFSAMVIILRLIWMYPGARLAYFIRIHILHHKEQVPGFKRLFVVGWTGMRGVIALAAAIALPQTLADGRPFAQRNMIIFLTFSVILVTLVLQGLTLPSLIRALGLAGISESNEEELEARKTILGAALKYLNESREKDPSHKGIYDDLEQHAQRHLATLSEDADVGDGTGPGDYASYIKASKGVIQSKRETAVRLRNEGKIGDELLRDIEHELDLNELRLQGGKRVEADKSRRAIHDHH
jgi:monovalent cation/hydrogen antiporter